MEAAKVVPGDRKLSVFDFNDPDAVALIQYAKASNEADHQLSVRQALKRYKKAVFWAMILSTTLVMEGYDLVIINSFYGQTQFSTRFGIYDEAQGKFVITAPWQSGLSNSALVGQLAGLVINGWAQDRFGSRRTLMFFLTWMALMIFIPVFAPSLPVLAFGEAMCGISWGVFQVSLSTDGATLSQLIGPGSLHLIRFRSRPYRSQTLRHRLCLHVLGCRHSPLLWHCSSCGKHPRRYGLATAFCPAMDVAGTALHCRLLRPRVALECSQAGKV